MLVWSAVGLGVAGAGLAGIGFLAPTAVHIF
jgi:hypothetical protein